MQAAVIDRKLKVYVLRVRSTPSELGLGRRLLQQPWQAEGHAQDARGEDDERGHQVLA